MGCKEFVNPASAPPRLVAEPIRLTLKIENSSLIGTYLAYPYLKNGRRGIIRSFSPLIPNQRVCTLSDEV